MWTVIDCFLRLLFRRNSLQAECLAIALTPFLNERGCRELADYFREVAQLRKQDAVKAALRG